ncbi:MAG TPA: GAF domain-containing sensor histidine kinase [Actinomycetota bacterium]|jgi:signal transduction histidine kinase|nr:GAF domain-containing sensor histidine kinase [Actinomycetota bacterium]
MSDWTRRRLGPQKPARGELLSLRERAVFLEGLRGAFALLVVVVAMFDSGAIAVSRLSVVLGTLAYLSVTAAPQVLTRLGRDRVLVLLEGALMIDGIYLLWVMSVTGGVQSPFRTLIYVHIAVVTLVASYRTGLKIALWHTLLYLLLFEATVTGIYPVSGGSATEVATSSSALRVFVLFQIGAFWMLGLATAAFSALNERELRAQKIDLEQLTEMVADIDHVETTAEIAATLLERLRLTFEFPRGVVLASPEDELQLLASIGDTTTGPVAAGLDGVIERAWTSRDVVLARRFDETADRRLSSLLPDARNVLVVPMFAERGYRLGVLAVEHPQGDQLKAWVVDILRQFASHAAMSLQSAWLMGRIQDNLAEIGQLKDKLLGQNLSLESRVAEQTQELQKTVDELREADEHRRRLLSHMVTAQEEERARIAGDVHDDPVQRVVAISMRLQLLRGTLSDPEQIEVIDRLLDSVKICMHSMRHLLFELRTPTLDEQGLGAAIRECLAEREPAFAYRIEDLLGSQPPSETRIVLYRIAQEALANISKHAEATEVSVKIAPHEGGCLVEIQDDGVGFSGDVPRVSAPGHLGLSSMRERAELAGGWCEIHSLAGEGTTVEFWLPGSSTEPGRSDADHVDGEPRPIDLSRIGGEGSAGSVPGVQKQPAGSLG